MNDRQRLGQRLLIGLILGAIGLTMLGIAFHPMHQGGVSAWAVLFLVLELACLAGLYQGRIVPKYVTLILLCVGTVFAGRILLSEELPMLLTVLFAAAAIFFVAFAAALLLANPVTAYFTFRSGKAGQDGSGETKS